MSENVFADEWMECLEAHYMHVIRTKDKVTEPSLSIVMHSAGFSDKQLAELRVRATMHIDDVGEDFVPDLDVLDEHDHEHRHDEGQAVEAHVYNIPIELSPARIETVQAVEGASEEAVEAQIDNVSSDVVLEIVEPEMNAESDTLPDDEPSPEELQEQEDEALVEEEIERHDPDAPQQLSLF